MSQERGSGSMRRPQVVEAGGWYGSHAFHFPNIQTAEEGDPEARFFSNEKQTYPSAHAPRRDAVRADVRGLHGLRR